ncbi:MAG: hypothetical protein GY711_32935 [bacterium]|nr:hypothetical protein [bacterium]
MASELAATWRMAAEVNTFVLANLDKTALAARYDSRTRGVAAQFAHMHDVRRRWLDHAAPDLAQGLEPLPKDPRPTAASLKRALAKSEKAIACFLEASEEAGKVKGGAARRRPFSATSSHTRPTTAAWRWSRCARLGSASQRRSCTASGTGASAAACVSGLVV